MAVRLVLHSIEHALVAQWKEQRFPKPRVAGSIPAGGTTQTPRSAAIYRLAEQPFRLTKGRWVPYGSRRGHEPVTIAADFAEDTREMRAFVAAQAGSDWSRGRPSSPQL